MTRKPSLPAVGLLLVALITLSACDASLSITRDVEGSDELVTLDFDLDGFDSVNVQNSFEADIEVGEPFKVEVIVNESLVDDLDVRVRDGELEVQLKGGISLNNGTLIANVGLPTLSKVEASGASAVDVRNVTGPALDLEASGASEVRIFGSTSSLSIEVSGASDVTSELAGVDEVQVDVSGASSLDLREAARVAGDVSGASDLTVPSDAAVDVDTSGASDINRS